MSSSPTSAPEPEIAADPVLVVAERQLVMLGELAELAMKVSRAFATSSIASAKAAEAILDDKFFMPEIGRARACGAKDAAEAFQKVSRAVRLTLKLEMAVAETVRDIRAGIVTHSNTSARPKNAGGTPAVLETTADRRRATGSCSDGRDTDVTRADRDTERLVDIEHADRLPRGSYCRLVEELAADIGATIDWESATVSGPNPGDIVPPNPPDFAVTVKREMALSP